MAFARVNGIVLHYELRGPEERPVLVFSNSLGTDFRIWNKVAALLEDDFRLVLYDKRGHGLSEASPQPYAMADHVNDLVALLDHLSIAQAVIIGVSVGGMIAQGVAAARPGLVQALVLSNTAHKIGTAEMWNGRIKAVNEQGIASIAGTILQRWFTPAYCKPENPDYVGYHSMLTRQSADGYAGTCAALRDADLTDAAKALTVPVLCIAGDQDGSTPPDLVRELASLISGARLEIIENAGHLPCIEQPERTAGLIRSFLNQAGIG
ncbi:3-oxoadipate enol-lactonase [Chelativorans sp. SCAU2101]|jgi:3-oxoadipate enol-lactonase|uniref:3-oxoadipate enol-lactonase n=1 Tax=Chelativorans petroleitrophicus TaxID=2975484 RepID=A0A9X3B6C1_9HYPH|nr:3-oxoadipate enol-lactonase [Chelativorans petroleitrophicus]MCT8990172.1 3-oxoadipate enol-lactonase [Chelativorans petroleitrophicus]